MKYPKFWTNMQGVNCPFHDSANLGYSLVNYVPFCCLKLKIWAHSLVEFDGNVFAHCNRAAKGLHCFRKLSFS